jgi:uncharacterized repeat protein (TIGR01451 family)
LSLSSPAGPAPTPASPAPAPTLKATVGSSSSAPRPAGAASLFSRQSPILGVETLGPRRISVGKEAAYEVVIRNAGEVAAEQVSVAINLPDWTDVAGAEASVGTTNADKVKDEAGLLRWRIERLEAKGRERLTLRLIPRQSKPFDLNVKWDYTPAPAQAMIEVQEPKVTLALQGPREILFGKGEIYRLEVANLGNGDAENVAIALTPSSPGEKQPPAAHRFGTLAAGQKKSIDVELTARQVGDLLIRVEARGDGGVYSELNEKIAVRRATLKVEVEAPKVHFVGTEATYRLRVTNLGTAPAKNLTVSVTLPSGTRFLSSPQGGRLVPEQNQVTWTVESIGAGAETAIAMNCDTSTPGISRLEAEAKADGDLKANTAATVQVEALPKLQLTVDDPAGPVMVGNQAAYQIHLQNRGSAAAEKVEVVIYFSNGFEPATAEGAQNKIAAGQIVFDTIPSIAAGQTLTLKVNAKAEAAGSHVFRVEVRSEPAGSRLVREGTTRFYGNATASPPATTTSK